MIECIFTLDYEIYGNGEGSLKELVYEPAEKLATVFRKHKARFVVFAEAAELEMIDAKGTDPVINLVRDQLKRLHSEGFEIGLHLHPQWYKARYHGGEWLLDYSEYNLCTLPRERVAEIVNRSIAYLQEVLGDSKFNPLSFRAGNWLFQPTRTAASVLNDSGIRVDSSLFKGGLQRQHGMDYRSALHNGAYWKFGDRVDVPDLNGSLLEVPIYTQMVPFWKMLTGKRVGLQSKLPSPSRASDWRGTHRVLDFVRFQYPLKFDFCRMAREELDRMVDRAIQEDQREPMALRPLVAIGHTKDLVDLETVESFLSFLEKKDIPVSTFEKVYPMLVRAEC